MKWRNGAEDPLENARVVVEKKARQKQLVCIGSRPTGLTDEISYEEGRKGFGPSVRCHMALEHFPKDSIKKVNLCTRFCIWDIAFFCFFSLTAMPVARAITPHYGRGSLNTALYECLHTSSNGRLPPFLCKDEDVMAPCRRKNSAALLICSSFDHWYESRVLRFLLGRLDARNA